MVGLRNLFLEPYTNLEVRTDTPGEWRYKEEGKKSFLAEFFSYVQDPKREAGSYGIIRCGLSCEFMLVDL